MKRTILISACVLFALLLASCGRTCKVSGCDASTYKSGYCEVHYALNALLG